MRTGKVVKLERIGTQIVEFFEPVLGEGMEEGIDDADAPLTTGKNRLAELRRRAELKLEEKRM